jgi:orotate phosphoribosyltransferase
MLDHQKKLLELLLETGSLKFGEFKTKSGRLSPYFVNTGNFCTGDSIRTLGLIYAEHIRVNRINTNQIYGPSYKGIPLAVATAMAHSHNQYIGNNIFYSFNRKEAKDHGETGTIVGANFTENSRVVIVDDVITSGLSMDESFQVLAFNGNPEVTGIVIAVDRMEVGLDGTYAIASIEKKYKVPVYPILTVHDILAGAKEMGKIDEDMTRKIKAYIDLYGVKKQA